MKYSTPITVRDAQRILTRLSKMKSYSHPSEKWDIICSIMDVVSCTNYGTAIRDCQAALSRIAQQQGANTIIISSPEDESRAPSGREHKIGTDEVAPQSDNPSEDSNMHGGDSSSGEVDDGHSAGGDNQSQSGGKGMPMDQAGDTGENGNMSHGGALSPSSPQSSETETSSGSCAETDDVTSAGDTGDAGSKTGVGNRNADSRLSPAPSGATPDTPAVAAAKGDGTSDMRCGQDSDDSGSVSEPLTGRANSSIEDASPDAQGKQASDTSDSVSENYRYRSTKSRSGGGLSRTSTKQFGGVTAKMRKQSIPPKLVRQARAALARLLEGGETQSGPRWDWNEFSKRLITHRPLSPARREEEGRPAILVLADVSGSCSGFSDISLLVAQAVARIGVSGSDIIVVSHSNGYPEQWLVNQGNIQDVDQDSFGWRHGEDAPLVWYKRILRKYHVEAVVALGDHDAAWLYEWLAKRADVKQLVWLDNWSCNNMPPTKSPKKLREWRNDWSGTLHRKTTYVVGCGSAMDFLAGLKLIKA